MRNMRETRILIGLLIIISPLVAFAQTNGFVSFQFTVDNSTPLYSNFNSNVSEVNNLGEAVSFSALWEDAYEGLDYYYFEWDGVNSTETSFVNGWSNETRTVDNANLEGRSIYYAFHAVDLNNNWNSTGYNTLSIISSAPVDSMVAQDNPSPTAGEVVEISSYWSDNFNVYNATLQTNYSGAWLDNQTVYLNTLSGWANYSWDTTGYSTQTIWWRINGFDNASNMNTTSITRFDVI